MTSDVPINRLLPHPDNPNQMPQDLYAKLRWQIAQTGKYPSVIVRSLGASARFGPGELVDGEKPLQIIDGFHRWKILRELGHTQILVDDWGDLDDVQAARMLVTLNRLRGKDDPGKRASLLSLLRKGMSSYDEVARYVPESADDIKRKVEKLGTPSVEPADLEKVAASMEPMTIMVDTALARVIRAAMRLQKSKGGLMGRELDPREYMTVKGMYDQARAIATICSDYILRNTDEK